MAGLGLELLGRSCSRKLGVMTKKSVCLGFMAFDVAFDLPAKETLGWRGAAKPLLLLEQLTMAHNQDRLQNSDSSVVYGHGHIIYSHTVAAVTPPQPIKAGAAAL